MFSIYSSRETWLLTFLLPRGAGGITVPCKPCPSHLRGGPDVCSAQDDVVFTRRSKSQGCSLRWQRSKTQHVWFCGRTRNRSSRPSSFLRNHDAQRSGRFRGRGGGGLSIAAPGLPEGRPVGITSCKRGVSPAEGLGLALTSTPTSPGFSGSLTGPDTAPM